MLQGSELRVMGRGVLTLLRPRWEILLDLVAPLLFNSPSV